MAVGNLAIALDCAWIISLSQSQVEGGKITLANPSMSEKDAMYERKTIKKRES